MTPELCAQHWITPKAELTRFKSPGGALLPETDVQEAIQIFRYLVRPKEGLVWFGEAGVLMTENPARALDELHQRFVLRQFDETKETHEQKMCKRLQKHLGEWKLKKAFEHDVKVGDPNDFYVILPFVRSLDGKPETAVKPFDLTQNELSDIYNHGDVWISKVKRLRERNNLPINTIFAVDLPPGGKRLAAATEICTDLKSFDVITPRFDEIDRLRSLLRPYSSFYNEKESALPRVS